MAEFPARQVGWLTVLVAAAALTLVACGGGGGAPQVADLGISSGPGAGSDPGSSTAPASGGATSGSTPASLPGNVTPLLNEWAACERGNGNPRQADPTVDASGVIWVIVPQGAQLIGNLHELEGTCTQYLAQAQNELRAANPVQPPPTGAENLKWVNCVRANGVPDYPYPTGDTTNFQGSGVNPSDPNVIRAGTMCARKLGLSTWWVNGSHAPGSIEVRTAGEPLNPTAPACFFQKVDPCSGEVTKTPDGPLSTTGPGAAFN
ncbi:MAG: hypothetical protein ACRDPY_41075, partial [Streptosporangiaceae bacterium]